MKNLADKHGITLFPTSIPTYLHKEVNYLLCGRVVSEWNRLSHIHKAAFPLWGRLYVDFFGTLTKQHYYTFKNPLPLGALGLTLSTNLEILGELCIPSSCINCCSSVQPSGRTCHRSIQTFDSLCVLLHGSSLASYCFQHVGRCFPVLLLCMAVLCVCKP